MNSQSVIDVAVLEDNLQVLQEVVSAISESDVLQLKWSGSSVAEGEKNLLQPIDVLICDLQLTDGMAFELIEQFRAKTSARVIVFSVFGDEQSTVRAIEAGASGYLLKASGVSDLEDNLRAIVAGESPISPAIAAHLLQRMQNRKPANESPTSTSLTQRETEVLSLLARGLRYKEVATELGCSYHTVAQHVRNIYEKLSVNSKSEAIFTASNAGLISLGK